MYNKNRGNLWRKDLREESLEVESLGRCYTASQGHTMRVSRMMTGKCLLVVVGKEPVGELGEGSLRRAGQVDTRCGDLGVNWR